MDIQYHTYTAADVRAWIYSGVKNGLSEQVISKIRANAILHNPCLSDDMVIVVTAADGDKLVGYTAMFPNDLVRPRVCLSCPTTLYADAGYAGEFIGYNVTKILHDTANGRMVIGLDMAKEAALIDKLLGMKVEDIPVNRYIYSRVIEVNKLHDLGSLILEPFRRYIQKRNICAFKKSISAMTQVEYSDFIDNEAYQFIVSHSQSDMYLQSQEMLNWRMRYPFTVNAPLYERKVRQNIFHSHVSENRQKLIAKVYEKGVLVGLYSLVKKGSDVYVALLYTEDESAKVTYDMLLLQVLHHQPLRLFSLYKSLNRYVDSLGIFLKKFVDRYDYTHPSNLQYSADMQVQGLDGDMLA